MRNLCLILFLVFSAPVLGGDMGKYRWDLFVKCWQDEVIKNILSKEQVDTPEEQYVKDHLKITSEPAKDVDIAQLEKRFNLKFPPSYLSLLKVTNGLVVIGMDAFDGKLLASDKVAYFKDLYPDLYKIEIENKKYNSDSEYFVYGKGQNTLLTRWNYFDTAIVISSFADSALYMLNPKVVDANGEWEAWILSPEQGLIRYRTFTDLLRAAAYQSTKMPEHSFLFDEEELINSCAKYLTK